MESVSVTNTKASNSDAHEISVTNTKASICLCTGTISHLADGSISVRWSGFQGSAPGSLVDCLAEESAREAAADTPTRSPP